MSDDDNPRVTDQEFFKNLDFENYEGSVFDLVTQSSLYKYMLEECEPEDREKSIKIVEASAKQYDKLIDIVRNNIKTEKDVEALLRALQSASNE